MKVVGDRMTGSLRLLIREMLVEDSESRGVDRIEGEPDGMRPAMTDLALKYRINKTSALADIKTALKQAGGDFDEAEEYIDHPPGEEPADARTIRRVFYAGMGGADAGMKWVRKVRREEEEEK